MDDITIGKTTVKDGVFGLIEREVGPIFNNWWMTGIIGFAFNDMAAEGSVRTRVNLSLIHI